VVDILDHSYLNETIENPTAENTILWVLSQMKDYYKENRKEVRIVNIKLWETPDSYTEWRLEDQ
jgi:6-pyruvoyltetrahydropterin/6-carboxytetrahydropterin synthase